MRSRNPIKLREREWSVPSSPVRSPVLEIDTYLIEK